MTPAEESDPVKQTDHTAPRPGFDDTARMPGHLLRRCQQIAVSIFLQECRAFDLTPLQFAVLSALDQHGPIDQVRLGGLTALDRTTVGVVVRKLEERGLASHRRSDRDRRSKMISIAEAGRELLSAAADAVATAQARIVAPLSLSERDQLLALLDRIAAGNNDESRAPLKAAPARPAV